MKKILLSLMTICAFVIVKGQSQVCGAAAIKRWTDEGLPGSQPGTVAPITIDGNPGDWVQHIVGPFTYFTQPVPTYQPDPHQAAVAPANVQLDDLKGTAGELDRPGQEHRDLRYFAFTYDQKNVFFYFRRPGNNSAQVVLYYFIDLNVDGFMRTGEPVIKIVYNGGQGTLSMAYFVENTGSNSDAAGSWVSGKGNAMSATVNRAGSNNTSQWIVGSADGWAMPGSTVDVPTASLPQLQPGELADGRGLTDTYSDGATATGYGAEFVIPWNFFRLYGGYNYGPGYGPLTYQSIFTWHVSLSGGNSGISGAEDNAGGCCSGLAVSGAPIVSKSGSWDDVGTPYNYRLSITYTNGRNLKTKVTNASIKVINPRDDNGAPIPEGVVSNWTVSGYRTGTCLATDAPIATSTASFSYGGRTIEPSSIPGKDDTIFTFSSTDLLKASVTINGVVGANGCYFVNVYAFGWPPLKSSTVSYQYSTEFDIQSTTCNELESGSSEGSLSALPVKLISFTAARSGQNVNLTWQTASEDNNTGFEIQRLTSGGDWQTVGFVPTKAVNGNSGSPLNYQYIDINTTKGVTQYRLRQIDKDYRSAYSVIRSVRGLGQKSSTIIYPNPSSDGKVNVVFDDANSIRDLSLMDVNGKTLKQWKGVTNNNIRIDNLNAGFYTLRIVNIETGEQVVEKFIVNKR